MIFTDPIFLFVFLPIVLISFYTISGFFGKNAALLVLFISSIIFYIPHSISSAVLLIISLIVNFIVGVAIISIKEESKRRRNIYLFGQGYNIVTLCYFKYKIVMLLFGPSAGLMVDIAGVAIPAGISFYTFHQAAFLADAYAREENVTQFLGRMSSKKSVLAAFFRYGAFVSFFPQLVIGPITYLSEFNPQIQSKRFLRLNPIDLAVGLSFIAIGMFKKVVVADNLAPTVEVVFSAAHAGGEIHPLQAWIGALAYMAQLYFDFSGYSDMALGLARMFGLRYPINFFSPFKANGIIDYYRRWHMTLTRVIARFLYTPLSVAGTRYSMFNRLSPIPAHLLSLWLPMLINFQIIGLWHGALWTFCVFGLMHGFWYALETEVRASKWYKSVKKTAPPLLLGFAERAVFFLPLLLSLAMFRSESVHGGFHLFSQMFGTSVDARSLFDMREPVMMLAGAFFIIYCCPNSVELMRRYRPAIMTYDNKSYGPAFLVRLWRPGWVQASYLSVLVIASLYYVSRQPPFLYQGF
ncbi:Peptidoglycan O-acetyltransferase [Roseivivax sp. THAF40]|uniref:MBOAT family O-acyltransferase n=1 Tax=unclassified Roseivivax TaxID=2639302 RepID=UPI001268CA7F|nr:MULTISPECIES: MBOAT family O-acyltransferase [unclassified Roseivivax]QFS83114.1 Peptidoglycan O-acetyltransferase [Roseivivax sp. THAF197b]QFT46858.1 Peptidoglycan O-acetyltransferase [Roseivivax sp. THAF40]